MSIITTTIATATRMKKVNLSYPNFFCFFCDGSQLHTIVMAENLYDACIILASHNSIEGNDHGTDLENNFVDWMKCFSQRETPGQWIESWENLVGEDSAYRVKPWAEIVKSGGVFQYDQDGWEGFQYDRGQDTFENLIPYMDCLLLVDGTGMPIVSPKEECRANARTNLETFNGGERLDHDQVEEEFKKWKQAKYAKMCDKEIPYGKLAHLDLHTLDLNMESRKKIGVKVDDIAYVFILK